MNMEFFELLNDLETLLENSEVDPVCRNAAGYYICNIVFIPCDVMNGNPIPVCASSCTKFFRGERCRDTFATITRFSTIVGYPFRSDCDNTLSHLSDFDVQLSASDYGDNCLDVAGIRDVVWLYFTIYCNLSTGIVAPNTTFTFTTETPTSNGGSESSSNSSDSGPVIISVSVVVGVLAVGILLVIMTMFLMVKKKRRRNTLIMKPTPDVVYGNKTNTHTG